MLLCSIGAEFLSFHPVFFAWFQSEMAMVLEILQLGYGATSLFLIDNHKAYVMRRHVNLEKCCNAALEGPN
jgi:hypothetical protein